MPEKEDAVHIDLMHGGHLSDQLNDELRRRIVQRPRVSYRIRREQRNALSNRYVFPHFNLRQPVSASAVK